METILAGIQDAFTIYNLLAIVAGIFLGIIIGAIPGLNAPMAIAIAVPLTYYLPTTAAIGFLLGINKGGTFGGSIAAILLNTPGTPEAAITCLDGYALAKKGKGIKAMKMALVSAVFGDTLSDLVLILVSAPLALVALQMGPTEVTAVILFSLGLIVALESKSLLKGLIAGCLGILVACIGMDPITTEERLTFGCVDLESGISILALGIGLLALSEVFLHLHRIMFQSGGECGSGAVQFSDKPEDNKLSFAEIRASLKTMLRSTGIGTFLGIMPGLGAILAAYLGYGMAKKSSKDPDSYGKGNLDGVAAAESAASSVCGANLVPLFTLGIPGNVAAAMLIGAFVIHGVTPGPLMFEENGEIVYGIFASILVANFLNLFVGSVFLRVFAKVMCLSEYYIFPIISLICITGAYVESSSMFFVVIMLATALLGYFFKLLGYPFITFIIGFILGPKLELSLQQMLVISDHGLLILFMRPVAAAFMTLLIVVFVRAMYKKFKESRETALQAKAEAGA